MHYHVIRHGENGGGKFGGHVVNDLPTALAEFRGMSNHPPVWLTEEHCRAVFARNNAVRMRDGDDWGSAPMAYLVDCTCTDGSCV